MHVLVHVFIVEIDGVRNLRERRIPVALVPLKIKLLAQCVFDDDIVALCEVRNIERSLQAVLDVFLQFLQFVGRCAFE